MEQRFQHDFSAVRVHTGPSAELSASDVNAQAYSVGSDIVFGAGRFAPGTHDGRRLIAHELAHVAQSGEAGPPTSQVVRRQPTNTNTPKNPDPNAPENRVGPLDTAQELGESGILFIPGPAAKPGEGLSIAGLRIPYRSFRLINPIEPRTVPQIPASTDDFADLVLDTGAPVGDAMVKIPGLDTPVAPGSTIGGCLLINTIKAEVAQRLTQAGQPPKVLSGAAVVGAEKATALFEAAYDEHARRLAKLYEL